MLSRRDRSSWHSNDFVSLLFPDFETGIPRAQPPLGKKWMLLSAGRGELGFMSFFTRGDAESSF